jgi:serine protease AprX
MSLRTPSLLVAAALICALSASPAAATPRAHSKFDLALRQKLAKETPDEARVIIAVLPGTRSAVRSHLKGDGDEVLAEFPGIDALNARVRGRNLLSLENNPAVLSVSVDAEVRPDAGGATDRGVPHVPDRALKYYSGLRAQLGLTGSNNAGEGITVAVIDSGIAPLTDFAGRIKAFIDFTRTNTPVPSATPYDDYGHGTHVAGLIGSSGADSASYAKMGVAPKVAFVIIKVLDKNGRGNTSNVMSAIQWVVANRETYGINVINVSLGHPIFEPAETDPLVREVQRATAAGLIVVASAGNFGTNLETEEVGYAGITSPGNAPSAITVGTLRTFGTIERIDDDIADYSSRGPTWYDAFAKPDVVAPGDRLVSDCSMKSALTLRFGGDKVNGKTKNDCYMRLSGTSMSAAVTTGAVALALEAVANANPSGRLVSPNAVKAILQYTAIPVAHADGTLYDGLTQGAGGLNAAGALTLAALIDTSQPVNAQWVPYVPEPVSTIGGQPYAWSRNIVWGTTVVSDSKVLYVNSLAWADNIVWGTTLDAGDNIVWGTTQIANIVWGTAAEAWGDNIVWGTGLLNAVDGHNIVWGTVSGDNIVWGTLRDDNIVWGTGSAEGDNIVWGTTSSSDSQGDKIVWGTRPDEGDNIVWGSRNKGENK